MTTPILGLDEMEQAQANPYLIFNAAIRALEANLGRGFSIIIHDDTAEHVIELAERGAYLRMTSASANAVVVPTDATLGIAAGDPFVLHVRQNGEGVTSFDPAVGVTIHASSLAMPSRYAAATLVHVGEDEWDLIPGNVEASS